MNRFCKRDKPYTERIFYVCMNTQLQLYVRRSNVGCTTYDTRYTSMHVTDSQCCDCLWFTSLKPYVFSYLFTTREFRNLADKWHSHALPNRKLLPFFKMPTRHINVCDQWQRGLWKHVPWCTLINRNTETAHFLVKINAKRLTETSPSRSLAAPRGGKGPVSKFGTGPFGPMWASPI